MIKFTLLFLLVLTLNAFVVESSYSIAQQKAKKLEKVLMVFLVNDGCEECNRELSKLLKNTKISALIEKQAVFTIVHREQQQSYPIEILFTQEFPTLYFLDASELFECDSLRGTIEIDKVETCLLFQ